VWGEAQRLITLDQAYRMALKNHPSIQLMQESVLQAKAARYKAWAAVKPSLSFQASFKISEKEVTTKEVDMFKNVDPPVVLSPLTEPGYNLVATLPLFVGPAYQAISLGSKQVELARLNQVRSRQDFLLQVAQIYYLVVSQKALVKSLQKKAEVSRQHLKAAEARFDVGKDPRVMMMRADLVATQDRQRLRSQRWQLKSARRRLAILLGLKHAVDVKRPAEPSPPRGTPAALLDRALKERKDYQATALATAMARQQKNIVWWQFAPTLSANFVYAWIPEVGFQPERHSFQILFTANLPMYDGGARYADLRAASSGIRQAQLQRRLKAQTIENDIVKLHTEVAAAEAEVVSARKAVKLATATAVDMQNSYEAGAVPQLDVLDATQRQLEAEIGLTRTLFKRDVSRLALVHAQGVFDPVSE